MKDQQILFKAPMVRAILDGRKTQTRRIVKPQPPAGHVLVGWCTSSARQEDEGKAVWSATEGPLLTDPHRVACPFGQPGDRLWVRETWGFNPDFPGLLGKACYRADRGHEYDGIKWRPSIHMPRAACRLRLEVTAVRVERLHDINEADALAEGIRAENSDRGRRFFAPDGPRSDWHLDAKQAFGHLWESVHGEDSWAYNPWVWVVEFQKVAP